MSEEKRIRVRYLNGFVTEYREEIAKRLLARKAVVLADGEEADTKKTGAKKDESKKDESKKDESKKDEGKK